jgi:hypothetical protein
VACQSWLPVPVPVSVARTCFPRVLAGDGF